MDNTVGSQQGNIIIGTLLGDGFLERNGKYVRLIIDHSLKQQPYLEWKAKHLKDLGGRVIQKRRFDLRTIKFYDHCIFRSNSLPSLEEYFTLFYKGRKKIIPPSLSKIINPQILAVWLMDDGYRRNDCNAMRLNTQSYTIKEQAIIQKALKTLGLKSRIHKQRTKFVIYIPSGSMNQLRQLVSKLIIPTMKYKIV